MSPTTGPTNAQALDTITKNYHRMKAAKAITYVERLRKESPHDEDLRVELEKLEEEEHRIMNSRERLRKSSNQDGRKLDELEDLFREWRKEADRELHLKKKIRLPSLEDREGLVKPTIGCRGPPCKGVREVGEDDDPARDLNVYFMFFKKQSEGWRGEDYHEQRFPKHESFPYQKISVYDALYDRDHNPFKPIHHEESGEPYLRYIHIPANHVGWIEQAMARYHDEHKTPPNERVKTTKTLSREFWKSQLHGGGLGRNPIHATHMRPRCSVIPGETQSLFGEQKRDPTVSGLPGGSQEQTKTQHKDLAIFMPYLHWETSSQRVRMTRTVQEVLRKEPTKDQIKWRRPRTTTTVFREIEMANHVEIWRNSRKEKPGKQPRQALARYLMKLAQVWQDMDMELDERLVKQDLLSRDTKAKTTEPLLHIRRTLDQSYFLHLKDTSQRDKDQVVYRATKTQGNLARVVMIDQLWLWILDEHTIITSFPKRWGRNVPDPSGIHESLRDRLGRRECKVMSARHLACIIIDQCSNVFFDRTRPLDLRPEVLDIFTLAIGDLNYRASIASKWFWFKVDRLTKSRDHRDSNYKRRTPTDIDSDLESILLREAQDIAEELKTMIRIYSKQLEVVKSFNKFLEQTNWESKKRNRYMSGTSQHASDPTTKQAFSPQAHTRQPVSAAEMEFMEYLIEEVEHRKKEIEDLEKATIQVSGQLHEFLSVKEMQANVIVAEAAMYNAEVSIDLAQESIQQGKAIMAFTVLTIIFTPLGFFTSFFGMNNTRTGADWMTLRSQCLYMFCISAMIIVIALSLAFNGSQLRKFIQHFIWSKSKPGDKTNREQKNRLPQGVRDARPDGNGDEGQSSGHDSLAARKYFGLVSRVGRNDHSQHDVENPKQDRMKFRSETANGKH